MEPGGGHPAEGPGAGAGDGAIDSITGPGFGGGHGGPSGSSDPDRTSDPGTDSGRGANGGLPAVDLVAPESLYSALLRTALRAEGVEIGPDRTAPVVLLLPPATIGELSSVEWSSRLDGIPLSVPMVVVAQPSAPVQHLLADRIRIGRASVLDATTSTMSTIVSMLRLAHDGRQVIDPPFAPGQPAPGLPALSEAEWSVLELLAIGLSNRAIADKRFVAERTVETHVRQIFQKLGLADDPATNRRVLAARLLLTGELGR